MVEFTEMTELMDDDVVNKFRWEKNNLVVKIQVSF
jgi:hypothetical protein